MSVHKVISNSTFKSINKYVKIVKILHSKICDERRGRGDLTGAEKNFKQVSILVGAIVIITVFLSTEL